MSNGAIEGQAWDGGRSPGRGGGGGGEPPRRSSRSRSPGRGNSDDRSREAGQNPGNNLHVSGLNSRVDTRDLEAAFAKIGRASAFSQVKKASVMYDPHTRESRGFGFVTMESAEEAEAAVTALNATEMMGKTITVEKARRGRARTPTPGERYYDPRPYDSRYARDHDNDDRRGGRGGRHDDRPPRDYDRGYRDYDRGPRDYDRGFGGGREPRDYDRRHDDRRY
ncbi:hypothetical protein BC834DRAFT_840103 [Gloeopeniophorella convolvens]|nr:hypothetical protein BC834DRAFT_840103 [Gloeopeniophorella convolvens]